MPNPFEFKPAEMAEAYAEGRAEKAKALRALRIRYALERLRHKQELDKASAEARAIHGPPRFK
jgi:high-affinity K+ transport system ATPase subunit B